ncbi:b(o/a)3-type cytochrome-c oxidase subunit 1 [Alkalihalobacillus macyae]|uniref:b(o/a)3-type cytochrome-c oxidase subunit 1 n=1 Tax=Guptibacillus hwajinpoensis TaxID=208199 RepID=UPI00273AD29D|nr:b(o/a)3-type cytochrome-c oxidase subunit 1 [Alkalihalobacillus macyae]MDP4550991.1 b(o/a)3-type cytochrome-c oxidase subunit 1 [Alkalihalobacillus macyae]
MISQVVDRSDAKLSMAHLYVAFGAVLLGGIAGLLQTLVRSGTIVLPAGIGYYQLLTAHGILLALVFTTYFIIGFFYAGLSRTLGKFYDQPYRMAWLGFVIMTLGTVLTTVMILLNEGTVLYTFYAPLKASPLFYIGLTFFIIGTWLAGGAMCHQYYICKKVSKKKLSPLFAFMAVSTMVLWFVATIGVAASVIFQFIPWSLGWVDGINILLSRTLFWYFGHPLVYFWLLPAYVCWYVIIPEIIGGKIFSDALARLSFVLFLLFSIPVGFHHQLLESGISPFWKFLQVVLTFMVIVPSLMTAFSLFATFEISGRRKGASSLFGWFKKLPWKDARFFAPMVGMLIFIPAGAGGIINASNQMNQIVHNTLWVTGHFHLTVASSVALTFFGIAYWLIPHLTGRVLTGRMHQLANLQTILWAVGMFFMSGAMHTVGLLGAPRRTAYTTYQDNPDALGWIPYEVTMALGGSILFIAIILLMVILTDLAFFAPKGKEDFPIGTVADQAEKTPVILENWRLWLTVVTILILVAYTVPVVNMIEHAPPGSPGYKFW